MNCQIILFLQFFPFGLSLTHSFDFIVVGAGTGGSVVATRLAEKYSVLLLEAGGYPDSNLDIPAIAPNYSGGFISTYETVRQLNAGLSGDGILRYIHGKTLGGSSAVNGMFMNRGSPHDYDNWSNLTGDLSWSYQGLLKYFRRFENYTGNNPSFNRGFSGPITVSQPSYGLGFNEWLHAGLELGYTIGDPNGPQRQSFSWVDFSQRKGRRVSSYRGYVEPLLKRNESNLKLIINAEVKRIVLEGNHAIGVEFERNLSNSTGNGSEYARAKREIIVSAGVIGSPLLLLRSGIGPKEDLAEANIPIKRVLPVGRNLHDHLAVAPGIILGDKSLIFNTTRDLTQEAWKLYEESGTGPYSSYLGSSCQGFVTSSRLSEFERDLQWPDIHLIPAFSEAIDLYREFGQNASDLMEWEGVVIWTAILTRPKSRGTIKLGPNGQPLIDFQYLTDEDDVNAIVDGIKILIRACEETTPFQRAGCRISSIPIEACRHLIFRSDDYFKCFVKQRSRSSFHAAGTCKMGKSYLDRTAVVDTKLRVIGIEGLRVVDASVMPQVTNANPQGAVYVIAEKGAEMILKKWKRIN